MPLGDIDLKNAIGGLVVQIWDLQKQLEESQQKKAELEVQVQLLRHQKESKPQE